MVLSCALVSKTRADDAILILDASKSMWGRIDGKTKAEIARSVVGELLTDIPAERRLGFVAYGHRRASDCNDIEELAPVGSDRAQMRSSLAGLEFKGKTPLTAAVRFAADKLNYTKTKATVILVSDGIESCHADPCAAGAALERAGIDLTVHVVGFGLKKREIKSLKCLADETGGTYFSASNAAELARALQQTVVAQPAPVAIEGSATVSGPASVPAGATFDVHWTGPDGARDLVTLSQPQDGAYVRTGETGVAVEPAGKRGRGQMIAPGKPGKYELRYLLQGTKIIAKTTLEVTPCTATLQAPKSVAAGSQFELTWTGPNNANDLLALARPNDDAQVILSIFGNALEPNVGNGRGTMTAPNKPGTYELRYALKREQIIARHRLEVLPAGASLEAPRRVEAGSQFEVAWTGPNNPRDQVMLALPNVAPCFALSIFENTLQASGETRRGLMTAPSKPGTYELRYALNCDEVIATRSLEVVPTSAKVEGPTSVRAGAKFRVRWTGPNNARDWITLAPPEGHAGVSASSFGAHDGTGSGQLDAPSKPGQYELRYVLRDEAIIARQPIVVTE